MFRGLKELGVNAHAVHLESAQEKEWYYRWLEPEVVVGVGYWGHTPHLTRCVAFCLDEYYPIAPKVPQSYASQMSGVAADLNLPMGSVHIPGGDTPPAQVDLHCGRYEEMIRRAGGIDLQLLGVGRSGHIGFNEPGAWPQSRTRLVQLDLRTRQDAASTFRGLDLTPREAITMGLGTILEAREVALIALGSHKAGIVRRLVEEPSSLDLPASSLRDHCHATVYLDAAAACSLADLHQRGTTGLHCD